MLCVGLRGATADVVILEEAAFMDKAVFYAVCVPLLGVKHTAMLAISTPQDEFNFYSELFELQKDNGDLLFYIIKIGLACDSCLENGLQCGHKLDKLPHWKPVERQALINNILSSNPDLADRETRGVVKSSRRELFEKQWIKAFAERPHYEWTYKPNVIWMAIDPAGGGNQSDFAICSFAYENSRHVIVGLDSTNRFKHNAIVSMIEGHLRMLRASEQYKNSFVFVFIEANYGGWWTTDIIRKVVEQQEFGPLEAVSFDETDKDRVGIWMRDEVKRSMAGEMQRSLADGQLCFAKQFITQEKDSRRKQAELREQMIHYREELVKPLDEAVGTTKKVITGKSSSRKDDLCIVAQIALYFSGKKRIDPAFRTLAQSRGWRY